MQKGKKGYLWREKHIMYFLNIYLFICYITFEISFEESIWICLDGKCLTSHKTERLSLLVVVFFFFLIFWQSRRKVTKVFITEIWLLDLASLNV